MMRIVSYVNAFYLVEIPVNHGYYSIENFPPISQGGTRASVRGNLVVI